MRWKMELEALVVISLSSHFKHGLDPWWLWMDIPLPMWRNSSFSGSSIMVAWHPKCAILGRYNRTHLCISRTQKFQLLNSQGRQSGMILIVVARLYLGCEFAVSFCNIVFRITAFREGNTLYLVSLIYCDKNVSWLNKYSEKQCNM